MQRRRLTEEESDRVATVLRETVRLYHGDTKTAEMFLSLEHPMLGGKSPKDVARESDDGVARVVRLLMRAEAGVAV